MASNNTVQAESAAAVEHDGVEAPAAGGIAPCTTARVEVAAGHDVDTSGAAGAAGAGAGTVRDGEVEEETSPLHKPLCPEFRELYEQWHDTDPLKVLPVARKTVGTIRNLPNGRVKSVVAPGVEVLKSVFHRFTDASNGVGVRLLALIAMATAAEDAAAERVLFAEGCLEIAIANIKAPLAATSRGGATRLFMRLTNAEENRMAAVDQGALDVFACPDAVSRYSNYECLAQALLNLASTEAIRPLMVAHPHVPAALLTLVSRDDPERDDEEVWRTVGQVRDLLRADPELAPRVEGWAELNAKLALRAEESRRAAELRSNVDGDGTDTVGDEQTSHE